MIRSALLGALVSAAVPLGVLAQTSQDLKNDANTPSAAGLNTLPRRSARSPAV